MQPLPVAQSLGVETLVCLLRICGLELPKGAWCPLSPGSQMSSLTLLSFFPGLKRPHQSCGSSPRPKQCRKQQLGGYEGEERPRRKDWITLGLGHRSWTLCPVDKPPRAR